jgi:hypothetical protein
MVHDVTTLGQICEKHSKYWQDVFRSCLGHIEYFFLFNFGSCTDGLGGSGGGGGGGGGDGGDGSGGPIPKHLYDSHQIS